MLNLAQSFFPARTKAQSDRPELWDGLLGYWHPWYTGAGKDQIRAFGPGWQNIPISSDVGNVGGGMGNTLKLTPYGDLTRTYVSTSGIMKLMNRPTTLYTVSIGLSVWDGSSATNVLTSTGNVNDLLVRMSGNNMGLLQQGLTSVGVTSAGPLIPGRNNIVSLQFDGTNSTPYCQFWFNGKNVATLTIAGTWGNSQIAIGAGSEASNFDFSFISVHTGWNSDRNIQLARDYLGVIRPKNLTRKYFTPSAAINPAFWSEQTGMFF